MPIVPRRSEFTLGCPLLAFAACAALVATTPAQKPPQTALSKKQLEELVEALVAIDCTARDALARELAVVAPLAGVPLPKEADLARLRQTIAKARAKRSLLPTKTGEYFVDPVTGAEAKKDAAVRGRLYTGLPR